MITNFDVAVCQSMSAGQGAVDEGRDSGSTPNTSSVPLPMRNLLFADGKLSVWNGRWPSPLGASVIWPLPARTCVLLPVKMEPQGAVGWGTMTTDAGTRGGVHGRTTGRPKFAGKLFGR